MTLIKALAPLAAITALVSPASANCPPKQSTESLQTIVEQWVTQHQPGVAMGLCAIAYNSAYQEGFACSGFADRENNRRLTKNTLFQIGSITKTMTATRLAQQLAYGPLDLDEKINSFVPPEYQDLANPITFVELATHHSGLMRDPTINGGPEAAFSQMLQQVTTGTLGSTATYSYSNLGYAVLGYTLANLDGLDWMTDVFDSVLSPLSMFETKTEESWKAVNPSFYNANVAIKYSVDSNGSFKRYSDASWHECPLVDPAACLYASSHDMRIWLQYAMNIVDAFEPGVRPWLRQSYAAGNATDKVGLAWNFYSVDDGGSGAAEGCDELPTKYYSQTKYTRVWKGGDAGYSHSSIEYLQDPNNPDGVSPLGVVVMVNSDLASGPSIDALANDLLVRLPLP